MNNSSRNKCMPLLAVLALSALLQLSCKKMEIILDDLLGSWEFRNAIPAGYAGGIQEVETIVLNPDYSISIGGWNSQSPSFAFENNTFRMVRGFTSFPHFTTWSLWEGEMERDGFIAGKIYGLGSLAPAGPIMELDKENEFCSFTATRGD